MKQKNYTSAYASEPLSEKKSLRSIQKIHSSLGDPDAHSVDKSNW